MIKKKKIIKNIEKLIIGDTKDFFSKYKDTLFSILHCNPSILDIQKLLTDINRVLTGEQRIRLKEINRIYPTTEDKNKAIKFKYKEGAKIFKIYFKIVKIQKDIDTLIEKLNYNNIFNDFIGEGAKIQAKIQAEIQKLMKNNIIDDVVFDTSFDTKITKEHYINAELILNKFYLPEPNAKTNEPVKSIFQKYETNPNKTNLPPPPKSLGNKVVNSIETNPPPKPEYEEEVEMASNEQEKKNRNKST